MAYVVKVKYGNTLRRLTMPKKEVDEEVLCFADLESRIRQLLELPAAAKLMLTYTDNENDVVTMASDQDVRDALVHQSLNPLRVFVALADGKGHSAAPSSSESAAERAKNAPGDEVAVPLQQLLQKLSASSDSVKMVVQSYEPAIERISSPGQAANLVENVMRAVAGQVASAVKTGADAAAAAATAKPFKPFGFKGASASGQTLWECKSRSSDAFSAAAANSATRAEGARAEANSDKVEHHNVACDVCGVSPIVGVRWKSNKNYNYDLCSSCFPKHGNESEYTKIEQSLFRPRHLLSHHKGTGVGQPFMHPMGPPPHFHGVRALSMRGPFGHGGRHPCCGNMAPPSGGKLDARFVCDVTMFDGTEVSPGTPFTKIWRLRNSGSVPWPVRTNLVHVGGDELGNVSMVPLEIPPQGLAPDAEMEVAVDLVAPEKLGRYVSHWRLASPAGPKFGHRIWVVIQVVSKESEADGVDRDRGVVQMSEFVTGGESSEASSVFEEAGPAPVPDLAEGASKEVAVTEPAKGEGSARLEPTMSFVNVEAPGESSESANNGVVAVPDVAKAEEAKEQPDWIAKRELSEEFSMVNVTKEDFFPASGEVTVVNTTPGAEAEEDGGKGSRAEDSGKGKGIVVDQGAIKYPVVDGVPDDKGPISYPTVRPVDAPIDVAGESAAAEVDLSTPNGLLGKLQAMGFTNAQLNSDLLEKNGFDLRKTLDDLCTVEEWESVLGELEEMGFGDTSLNVRLMFQNNGSVKRVVKELVQMYRARQGKD